MPNESTMTLQCFIEVVLLASLLYATPLIQSPPCMDPWPYVCEVRTPGGIAYMIACQEGWTCPNYTFDACLTDIPTNQTIKICEAVINARKRCETPRCEWIVMGIPMLLKYANAKYSPQVSTSNSTNLDDRRNGSTGQPETKNDQVSQSKPATPSDSNASQYRPGTYKDGQGNMSPPCMDPWPYVCEVRMPGGIAYKIECQEGWTCPSYTFDACLTDIPTNSTIKICEAVTKARKRCETPRCKWIVMGIPMLLKYANATYSPGGSHHAISNSTNLNDRRNGSNSQGSQNGPVIPNERNGSQYSPGTHNSSLGNTCTQRSICNVKRETSGETLYNRECQQGTCTDNAANRCVIPGGYIIRICQNVSIERDECSSSAHCHYRRGHLQTTNSSDADLEPYRPPPPPILPGASGPPRPPWQRPFPGRYPTAAPWRAPGTEQDPPS